MKIFQWKNAYVRQSFVYDIIETFAFPDKIVSKINTKIKF